MAEECDGKEKIISKPNQDGKKYDGWIVCRSQRRPEYCYDFNTITGEAVWRDSETITPHKAIMDNNEVQFGCHEPIDPPINPKPYRHHNAPPRSSAPKIYNKQIINNQFPAKPFTVDPFANAACAPYGFLNQNNAIAMSASQVWLPPPVLISSSVTPLNQLPTIPYLQPPDTIEDIQLQNKNTSLTLSTRFQVLKQINDERHDDSNLLNGGSGNQNIKNCNPLPPRQDRNFVNRHLNKQNDLRSLLSSRRRQDLQNDAESKYNPETKEDVSARLSEDDLNPDDTDEWLEAHTDGEGKKLNIDVGCLWDLADSGVSRDCWYIIPTTRALLNNMRLLTSLVNSDERLRLLAPRDVVRALRSIAFSDDSWLADCASRARTFVIRQMSKVPSTLKDAANIKSCCELMGPNTHAVHLIDEKDAPNKECTNLQITPAKLKRYLELTVNSKPKAVSKMQTNIGNIKILVINEEAKRKAESPPRFNPTANTPTTQPTETERTEHKEHDLINTNKAGFKETEIKRDLIRSPLKLTANAFVQTDIDLSTDLQIKPKASIIRQVAHTAEASSDSIATKAPTRKIRLRRQQSTNTGTSNETKTFRWRKRKGTALRSSEMPSPAENSNKTCSRGSSPPPSSTSDLLAQQNDNAMDCEPTDFSVQVKIVDESSTSAVISNSIDSETMFKINKEAILSESRTDRPSKEIDMYDITGDCMKDRLSIRCDEWVSRFVQIMEEVLTQVLELNPPFVDSTLPPPWTIQEATVCVKRKLKEHPIIVEASDKLDGFLMKIKYDRGNITDTTHTYISQDRTRISPTDFMLMYSYGVNLVNKLQLVLENCEDLHIASQNLSKLLSDIRNPNLDESEMENFNCHDAMDYTPNISETVTNASTSDARDALTTEKSPQKQSKNISCNNSPARYSLRSSRSTEKTKQEENTEAVKQTRKCKENKDYTLFASLGLQKNKFIPEKCIQKTISNIPKVQEHLTPPVNEAQGSAQDVQENSAAQVKPKVINFSICPQIENKLKGLNYAHTEGDDQNDVDCEYSADDYGAGDYSAGDYAADDNAADDYVADDNAADDNAAGDNAADNNAADDNAADDNAANGYVADDNAANDYAADDHLTEDYIDFEGDGNANAETHNDDNCDEVIRTAAMDADQNLESKKSGNLNANQILKIIVCVITKKYRECVLELHKFCEVTSTSLKSKDCRLTEYQINMEMITKVSEHAKNVCNRLKSILNRDPCVTREKFRALMKHRGIQDFHMSDTQLTEYRVTIEKYLVWAEQLSLCVTRLADVVRRNSGPRKEVPQM